MFAWSLVPVVRVRACVRACVWTNEREDEGIKGSGSCASLFRARQIHRIVTLRAGECGSRSGSRSPPILLSPLFRVSLSLVLTLFIDFLRHGPPSRIDNLAFHPPYPLTCFRSSFSSLLSGGDNKRMDGSVGCHCRTESIHLIFANAEIYYIINRKRQQQQLRRIQR